MPKNMKVLILQEEGWWVAQGLEYDIVMTGDTMEEALTEFVKALNARLRICKKEGVDPFDIPEAPSFLWNLFNKALFNIQCRQEMESPVELEIRI